MKIIFLILILCLTSLTGCSSEERKTITDKEAQKQVDHIKKPIDKAKEAAKLLDQHNQQQQLPD